MRQLAIYGAGGAGRELAWLAESCTDETTGTGYEVACFIDDQPAKHGKLIHGVPVIGRPEAISQVKDGGTLSKAVIAMPSASAKRTREVVLLFTEQGRHK